MRERDLAAQLGISEAEFVAAWLGEGATRIEPRIEDILNGLGGVGEVMALTRNESAVHEKIGVYENVKISQHSALVLGSQIDLRIFPRSWVHGFAVEKRDGDDIRRSLQFFDARGEAVHKVHLRPSSNLYAYQNLVADLAAKEQNHPLVLKSAAPAKAAVQAMVSPDGLRARWGAMTDVHELPSILKDLQLTRYEAVRLIGNDYAWLLDGDALSAMFRHVVQQEIPIMCFVANRGCVQIHVGQIRNVKPMGPWLNVMDETFHLHLRLDHVRETWAVRKPTKDGHVTSVEAYDADGRLVIQFFGERHEGEQERDDWRFLAENLPRVPQSTAA